MNVPDNNMEFVFGVGGFRQVQFQQLDITRMESTSN
jgi:hypothetical protein